MLLLLLLLLLLRHAGGAWRACSPGNKYPAPWSAGALNMCTRHPLTPSWPPWPWRVSRVPTLVPRGAGARPRRGPGGRLGCSVGHSVGRVPSWGAPSSKDPRWRRRMGGVPLPCRRVGSKGGLNVPEPWRRWLRHAGRKVVEGPFRAGRRGGLREARARGLAQGPAVPWASGMAKAAGSAAVSRWSCRPIRPCPVVMGLGGVGIV